MTVPSGGARRLFLSADLSLVDVRLEADHKLAGIAKDKLKQWSDNVGWETLLNRAGTTFKKLPDDEKEGLNERKAIALMAAQPSMIKRPVLDLGGKLLVGFKPDIYARDVASKSSGRKA